MRTYLTRANLILLDEIAFNGSLLIEDGMIAAINPVAPQFDRSVDLNEQYLMPGMVDLHSDQIEKLIEPRPGVSFDPEFAYAEADARSAMSGITTPFHALSFAGVELGLRNDAKAQELVRHLVSHREGKFAQHRIHVRYEVTNWKGPSLIKEMMQDDLVDLISVMNHSPGQGQFRDQAAYVAFMRRTYQVEGESLSRMLDQKARNADGAQERVADLVRQATRRSIRVASHDDCSEAAVEEAARLGITISEFPMNLAAARAAHRLGLKTMFGSPNILRGCSQGGAIRALDAVMDGSIDCLCSDYYPATMAPAAFLIPQLAGWTLPAAVRLVTANPAAAVGLTDRGAIQPGRVADLAAVHTSGAYARINRCWHNGVQVYAAAQSHDIAPD